MKLNTSEIIGISNGKKNYDPLNRDVVNLLKIMLLIFNKLPLGLA